MSRALLESPTTTSTAATAATPICEPPPQLSAEEERALALRIKHGDQGAVERLVLANLGLVGRIARSFLGYGASFDDLRQEGIQGMLRACASFNPEVHGTRFSTYASYAIRNAIQDAVKINGSMIRLPDYMVRLRSKYRRTVGALASEEFEKGVEATRSDSLGVDREIADRLGVSLKTLDRVRQSEIEWTQFHGEDGEGDSSSVEASIADDARPLFDIESAEELSCLREGLDMLAPHEAWIIRQRFGLDLDEDESGRGAPPPKTIRWIARTYGMSTKALARYESAALAKLKEHMLKRIGFDD